MCKKKTLEGLKIKYKNDETILITESLGKGARCYTYKGYHLGANGEKKNIVIVKEFSPNLENYEYGLPIMVKDDVFLYRYLPVQRDEIKQEFENFFKNEERIQNILNSILVSDTSDRFLQYNLVMLNGNDIIKEFNDQDNTYRGFLIYNYDSKDFGKSISSLTITERLKAFLYLCNVVNAFHRAHIGLMDLKPENFIYISEKDNSPMSYLKFFDFDSFVALNDSLVIDNRNVRPNGTEPFVAPELKRPNYLYLPEEVGARTDVYSLGTILYNFMICDVINEYKEFDKEEYGSLLEKENNYLKAYAKFSNGFIKKLSLILEEACWKTYKHRYENNGYAKGLLTDVENLLEIYQNKGVHPEVMLDNAKNIATEFNNELKDFDEGLLCDCVVVDDETE